MSNPVLTSDGHRSAFKPLVFLAGVIGMLRYTLAGMTLFGTTVPTFDAMGFTALMGTLSALYCGRHATRAWERSRPGLGSPPMKEAPDAQ